MEGLGRAAGRSSVRVAEVRAPNLARPDRLGQRRRHDTAGFAAMMQVLCSRCSSTPRTIFLHAKHHWLITITESGKYLSI